MRIEHKVDEFVRKSYKTLKLSFRDVRHLLFATIVFEKNRIPD